MIIQTQSAGSTEFPFKSLWFSSLVRPSFVNGSNIAAGPPRSGNSAYGKMVQIQNIV